MRQIFRMKNVVAFLTLILLIGASDSFAQKRRPVLKRRPIARKTVVARVPVYTVSTGTTMRPRMNETLSSKTARVGDTFTATITEPVYSTNGVVVVPVGSTIRGRVDTVSAAAKSGKPGSIDVSFTRSAAERQNARDQRIAHRS